MEEVERLLTFGNTVGLPLCLTDMGVTNVEETARELAQGLQDDHFMVNLTCDYSVATLTKAFCQADTLATRIRKGE